MANPLPPSVVRAVVREWLSSKNAVLDMVIARLVDSLEPHATESANFLLLNCLDPDPREAIIDELTGVLSRIETQLIRLDNEEDPDKFVKLIRPTLGGALGNITHALSWVNKRRCELRGQELPAQDVIGGKGGAA